MTKLTRQQYIDAVKAASLKILKDNILQIILTHASWAMVPPLGFIVTAIVNKLCEKLVDRAEMIAFFKYVDFRVDAQGRSLEQAMVNNLYMQTHGTKEQKDEAEKILIEKFRAFAILRN